MYVLAGLAGYGGTVTTQAISYVADDFGKSQSTQSFALAIIRLDWILLIPLVRLYDRRGAPRLTTTLAAMSILCSCLVALSHNFVYFVITQLIARTFFTALAVVVAVRLAETSSTGQRGCTSATAIISAGIGSGLTLVPLALADTSISAWRAFYVVPVLVLPLILVLAAHPVRQRLLSAEQTGQPSAENGTLSHLPTRKFATLALGLALCMVFINPSTQLLNEYLRDAREFSSPQISFYLAFTNIFGAMVLVGGKGLSDKYGRRTLAVLGVSGYVIFQTVAYMTNTPTIWLAGSAASAMASLALPIIPLMPAELSRGNTRGQRSGDLLAASRIGGLIGLTFVSVLVRSLPLGQAIAILALPALAGSILLLQLPATHDRELSP